MNLSMTPFPRRLAAATAVAGLGTVLLGVAAASAHVRVKPDTTTTGSYASLTFRVPNESDTASTTKVVLTLPQDKPLGHVSVRPVPGWTAVVTDAALPKPVTTNGATLTKAPRTVTWTATSRQAAVAPGQYQEFAISAGPLPAPGAFVLPVAQTYSDGEVVAWDTPQAAGQAEPEHPAPQFDITPATTGGTGGSGGTGGHVGATDADLRTGSASSGGATSDPVARALGGGALAVAAVGTGLAAVRSRRDEATR